MVSDGVVFCLFNNLLGSPPPPPALALVLVVVCLIFLSCQISELLAFLSSSVLTLLC